MSGRYAAFVYEPGFYRLEGSGVEGFLIRADADQVKRTIELLEAVYSAGAREKLYSVKEALGIKS